jgi:hypothetical protein
MESLEPHDRPRHGCMECKPNSTTRSNSFPTATPGGAARPAARFCGSSRGSIALSLSRERAKGQPDSLDERGR